MLEKKLKQLDLPLPIAIIGAGVTGKSFFDLLQLAKIDCQVFDELNSIPKYSTAFEQSLQLGAFQKDTFFDFGTILISPGVDARRGCFAAVKDKLLTDIELFAQLTEKPVIGVTASNGKSTVVTLINDVTEVAGKDYTLCGNIGLSVLSALTDKEASNDGYIIELSSYHLEHAPSLKPALGIWLNVSPDHLDRYESYDEYVATKAKLFEQSHYIIANADDDRVNSYAKKHKNKTLFSQQQEGSNYTFSNGEIHHHNRVLFALKDFPQIGKHHADNLMSIFAVAEKLGIDEAVTARACKAFKPLPSRAVVVGQNDGVTFINDSKGTNIGATVAAIKGIKQPIVLIAGGQGKDQDFNELAEAAKGRVTTAILFGQDAKLIQDSMQKKITSVREADLDNAFAHAIKIANTGDVVMLSPACASFDQFDSYLKRGERFESLVKEWIDAK